MAIKIAFCISGQLRDEELSFPAAAKLAHDLGAQVFVSVWSKRGTKVTGVILETQSDRMFGSQYKWVLPREIFVVGFSNVFPRFEEKVLGGFSEVTAPDIRCYFPNAEIDIEHEALDLTFQEPVPDNNSLKMLYKIWRANEMKRRYERRNSMKFDLVVRSRPDIVPLLTPMQAESMLNDAPEEKFWTPHDGRPRFVGDVFSVSTTGVADYFASLFGKAIQSPFRSWGMIHHELYDHLEAKGIGVHHINSSQWLMENFERRQENNRRAVLSMVEELDFDSSASIPSDHWRLIHWILKNFEDNAANGNLAFLDSVHYTNRDSAMFATFPREAFGLAAAGYDTRKETASKFVAELYCLVADLDQGGHGRLASTDLRDFGLSIYKAGISLGIDDLFGSEWLPPSPPGVDPRLTSCVVAYMNSLGNARIRRVLEILAEMRNTLEFRLGRVESMLHDRHDPEGARAIAESVIEEFPNDWRSYDLMSHISGALGNAEDAATYNSQALALNGKNGGLWTRAGHLAAASKNFADAKMFFLSATELWNHPLPWLGYIRALIQESQMDDARRAFQLASLRFPAEALADIAKVLTSSKGH